MKLDPWDDAQMISKCLALPDAQLIVVIGSLTWCQKCRDYLPIFDNQAALAPANQIYVWLDIDEHKVFLGDFMPDDLPLQLTYKAGQFIKAVIICTSGYKRQIINDPEIYTRLCINDWAN